MIWKSIQGKCSDILCDPVWSEVKYGHVMLEQWSQSENLLSVTVIRTHNQDTASNLLSLELGSQKGRCGADTLTCSRQRICVVLCVGEAGMGE